MADVFLVIKLGQRPERSGRKEKKQRVLRYGGAPGSNKDKCDQEGNPREKRMLQIRHKLRIAILMFTNTRKENRNQNEEHQTSL